MILKGRHFPLAAKNGRQHETDNFSVMKITKWMEKFVFVLFNDDWRTLDHPKSSYFHQHVSEDNDHARAVLEQQVKLTRLMITSKTALQPYSYHTYTSALTHIRYFVSTPFWSIYPCCFDGQLANCQLTSLNWRPLATPTQAHFCSIKVHSLLFVVFANTVKFCCVLFWSLLQENHPVIFLNMVAKLPHIDLATEASSLISPVRSKCAMPLLAAPTGFHWSAVESMEALFHSSGRQHFMKIKQTQLTDRFIRKPLFAFNLLMKPRPHRVLNLVQHTTMFAIFLVSFCSFGRRKAWPTF